MSAHKMHPNWVPLGLLTWNTRIGLGFTDDTWEWVLENIAPVHVVFLQEVRDVRQVQRIVGDRWYVWPRTWRHGTATEVVLIRKKRFRIEALVRKPIFSTKHERHITGIDVTDKRSERPMFLGSLHVDPLGAGFVAANPIARARHVRQVAAWAQWLQRWQAITLNGRAFVGGDFNERMHDEPDVARRKPRLAKKTAMALFRKVHMRPAHQVRKQHAKFDDVFAGGKGLRLRLRRTIDVPDDVQGAKHLDHELVYVLYAVRKDESGDAE
jgi:hypothetical protein